MAELPKFTRLLIMEDEVIAQIAELKQRAETNPIPLDAMRDRVERFQRGEFTPSMNLDMAITIPEGFLVTFEHEEHPLCTTRHLSVSLDAVGKVAEADAVARLMREFGFVNVLQECVVYILPCEDGPAAVHVVEPLDGNMQRLLAAAASETRHES